MKKSFSLFALFVLPLVASAQATVQSIIAVVQNILNLLIPVLITLAIVYFFYGLAQYILGQSSEDSKIKGRNIMIQGIIALFIMVSIWGIIQLIGNTFGVSQGGTGAGLIPRI